MATTTTATPPSVSTDVLVVGGGPTGLTTATTLAQSGVDVEVIERDDGPIDESRAVFVQVRVREIFDKLGLGADAEERGHQLAGVLVLTGGRPRGTINPRIPGDVSPYQLPLVLEQSRTQRLLLDALARRGRTVRWSTTLDGLTQDDRGVTATVTGPDGTPTTIRARYLVGADGAGSTVRDAIGVGFAGTTYPAAFFLADVDLAWPYGRELGGVTVDEHGIAGFFPMPGERRFRILGTISDEVARRGDFDVDDVRAALATAGMDLEVSNPRWVTTYRIHKRRAASFREGRVFLAGDSAHIHSPAGGQGMNLSIGDGFNLGWKLAAVCRGEAGEALLASYEDERIATAEDILRRSDRVMDLETASGPVLRFARRFLTGAAAVLVERSRVLNRYVARFVSQLALAYPDSPVVAQADGARRARAGERAPYGHVTVDGARRGLFDVIRGLDHHLLVFEGTDGAVGVDRHVAALTAVAGAAGPTIHVVAVSAVDRRLHETYAASAPTAVLIRPDGHIGYRGPAADAGRLARHLAAVYGAPVAVPA